MKSCIKSSLAMRYACSRVVTSRRNLGSDLGTGSVMGMDTGTGTGKGTGTGMGSDLGSG